MRIVPYQKHSFWFNYVLNQNLNQFLFKQNLVIPKRSFGTSFGTFNFVKQKQSSGFFVTSIYRYLLDYGTCTLFLF
ncbi:hypothetical protein EON70_00625 [bacterium]|nr:MAG: hypothetical protein EON70_00625 [bacterium]